jgi:hypothetical protein
MSVTATATVFEVEQSWTPVNLDRTPPTSSTGTTPDMSAGWELMQDAVWRHKIQRGLSDSMHSRVRTLQDHLDSV